MLEPKRIVRFTLLFVVSFGILMGVRQWVAQPYANLFRWGGNVAFSRFWFWGDARVRFLDLKAADLRDQIEHDLRRHVREAMGLPADPAAVRLPPSFTPPPPRGVKDTLMLLWNRSTPNFGALRTSSRMIGYSPTIVIIALFLATPTSWRRRGRGLLWGLLLIHAFVFLRLSLTIATNFAGTKSYALFHPSEFWMGVLTKVEEVVVHNPTCYLAVAVVIWLLVCFLTGSFSAFRQPPSAETAPGNREGE